MGYLNYPPLRSRVPLAFLVVPCPPAPQSRPTRARGPEGARKLVALCSSRFFLAFRWGVPHAPALARGLQPQGPQHVGLQLRRRFEMSCRRCHSPPRAPPAGGPLTPRENARGGGRSRQVPPAPRPSAPRRPPAPPAPHRRATWAPGAPITARPRTMRPQTHLAAPGAPRPCPAVS